MQALRTLQAQRSIHLQKAVVIAGHSASGARRDEKKPKCQMTKEQLAAQLEHLDPGARLGVDERELAAAFEVQELGTTSVLAQVEAFAEQHRCTCSFYGYGNKPAFDKDDVF
jgi:hypothetical protein